MFLKGKSIRPSDKILRYTRLFFRTFSSRISLYNVFWQFSFLCLFACY